MEFFSIASAWEVINFSLFAFTCLCDVTTILINPPSYAHAQRVDSSAESQVSRLPRLCSTLCSGIAFLRFSIASAITIINSDESAARSVWIITSLALAIRLGAKFGEWRLKHHNSLWESNYTWAHVSLDIISGICVWIWGIPMYVEVTPTMWFVDTMVSPLMERIVRCRAGSSEDKILWMTCYISAASFSFCAFCVAAYGLVNATTTLRYLENGTRAQEQAWALAALLLYINARRIATEGFHEATFRAKKARTHDEAREELLGARAWDEKTVGRLREIKSSDEKIVVSFEEEEDLDAVVSAVLGTQVGATGGTVLTPTDGRIQVEPLNGRRELEASNFFMHSRM
ncbi:hypothetical protein W97_01105 [Coniosporium apollinis CBS 100218]|uniref:Uncharacterized protein n=1 Tax=Coniosporium apollinis (strain CBS 100218) TaxID=1168221 RepID=R7YIY5_CONA1|nr:uncharacterized protein W97_01105 [Coniosporium apollinis CBS 100218]EON61887.1 hypothetical protein W97_01105 [Coniosporium apollinis CBS 100218]